MFADQAGFEANLQGWIKPNEPLGFGAAVIRTFLQSVKSPEPLTDMQIPSFGTSWGLADAA